MTRSVLLRLIDIRDGVGGVQSGVENASYDAFAASWAMQRAVERGFEIISEASRRIPDDLGVQAPATLWRQIAAIGSLLRHEY